MQKYLGYRCSICNKEYPLTQEIYTCPMDGGNLDVMMDISGIKRKYEIEDITSRKEQSLWRYLPLLPVKDPGQHETPLRMAGWTPIYAPKLLAENLGLKYLWIKDEGRNPTGSFKDRASAIVVARAKEIGSEVVVTASTGNAGAALAGMAAAVHQEAVIFAPQTAPPAKVAQLLIYGAKVILVDGNYDAAFDLSVQAAEEFGWYCRNTGYNPFTVEGKKTAAFEIWEQVYLIQGVSYRPLSVFVSVGDGNIISGLHKGFKDLCALGWLEQMPKIFGVQSEGSAAVANAYFANSEEIIAVSANTLADSIAVDLPRDGVRAVRAAAETNGAYVIVPDQAIVEAIGDLGRVGIFAEPAGAAAYAGLKQAINDEKISVDDPVLVINTGSGLKDIKTAMQAVHKAPIIKPSMDSLRELLGK